MIYVSNFIVPFKTGPRISHFVIVSPVVNGNAMKRKVATTLLNKECIYVHVG